jgi:hypothetical protein
MEPAGKFEGMITCLQVYICRNCKTELSLPIGQNPNDRCETSCAGLTSEQKEKWKAPIKNSCE